MSGDSAIFEALALVTSPMMLLVIGLSVVGGIIVGAIPGLTATMALALLIPVSYSLPPDQGIAMMVAVYVGGISAGALTAILIRMPGTPAAVATVADGFPMAQQGRAGQAIGNAVVASFAGTVISGVCLVLFAPTLADFAVKFFFSEIVAVAIFGLTAVIAVSGKSLSRGLFTALLGMLVATFGMSTVDGISRFDFGNTNLQSGIGLMPMLIGMFAVSQLMKTTSDTQRPSQVHLESGPIYPPLNDIAGNTTNYVRSSLIGTIIGVIPSLGSGVAGLVSYAQARNASDTPEKFGTGHVPGIIASEAANNAAIGGALIIALTLGIPGDPPTAILLGALMIHGVDTGPMLFENNSGLIYSIYFSLFASSVLMMLFLLAFGRYIAKVTRIPNRILSPIIFALCVAGVFSGNNLTFDLGVMLVFGLVGFLLDRGGYPLAPFIIGFLLGPLIEDNYRRLMSIGGLDDFVTRPISAIFIALAVASVLYSFWKRKAQAKALAQ